MPKVSWAETINDWDLLLHLAEPYGEVKDLKVHLAELQAALQRLQGLKNLRDELQARRQRATQEMGETRESGKDVAIQIRSILRGVLGPSNELLVQFNVRPRRSRRGLGTPASAPDGPASAK
jgi:hypothetical protein